MKTQTSIAARTCRLHEWAQMVQECNQRPVGMSVSEWCEANSITKANYYYRMTQVRKACLDSIPDGVMEQTIVPVPANIMCSRRMKRLFSSRRKTGPQVRTITCGFTEPEK